MARHDPDLLLRELILNDRRLCFYPSSGNESLWVVMRLDADVFIFCDRLPQSAARESQFWNSIWRKFRNHGIPILKVFSKAGAIVFRSGEKWGFFFFQENNDVLKRIDDAGGKIQQFVGVCDGCREGGNHECVHDDPFLGKLLSVASKQMDYFTDHSEFLQKPPGWRGTRPTYHLYKKHFSGWDFTLKSLLVLLSDPDVTLESETKAEKLAVLRFPDRRRMLLPIRGEDANEEHLPLGLLAPFRETYRRQMLAHYVVEAPSDSS